MDELINLAINSGIGEYVIAVCLLCRIFTSLAPIALTEKIPDLIMQVINKLALASNNTTDASGNQIDVNK